MMVAALFASDGALPFDLMLVYPRPAESFQGVRNQYWQR
jgi:hypothetical protein